MKYEDLIKISDPYKVYIKFKEIQGKIRNI